MIDLQQVSKKYDGLNALSDITAKIADGEFLFLIGKSGAGKSTILKLIIKEEEPTAGKIFVDDLEISNLLPSQVPHLRRRIGTIFQDFKLLPQRTVFENVSFPLEIIGLPDDEIAKTTNEILSLVNLDRKSTHFPNQLSGGESQRTAIARAIVLRPEIILADEPTGNLDSGSAWEVMKILNKLKFLLFL
ncbi:ATP-binding cassette domain-containing protein [candidate division TA06 bacterium]|nr:ATP-binding cassette domain-containing protein [candidate division TA06 bacterium]